MAAGNLVALSGSIGDLDCSDNLSAFEAFQKVFIANGSNLKVADFKNHKLTHAAFSPELKMAQYSGTSSQTGSDSSYYMAMEFTPPSSFTLSQISLYLYRIGLPGTVTVELQGTDGSPKYPNGVVIESTTFSGDDLTTSTSGAIKTISFPATFLSANTTYALVLKGIKDNSNKIAWMRTDSDLWSFGVAVVSSDAGINWSALYKDFNFRLYETSGLVVGEILTQAVSGAQMAVEFNNAANTETYGYVTSGTFDTDNLVTGSVSGITFTPTAVTANPHWYDWTAHPGGASGEMPEKAYLGCLYRGRCVLSGNPNYPYQWYMSRVADPYDWAYTANDSLSPVAGGNHKAGKLGDIIRALIPYQDEYLLFGCASSIWALRGDPAEGGSLTPLNTSIGIFGSQSWCFDAGMNLYFVSKNGIHKVPYGFGPVQNLSQFVLPNLIEDTNLDPTVHRVTMAYDPEREGILISITVLDSGSNVCYWYDLKTEGFYPESYPAVCGAYSMYFHSSNDDEYRKLLIGGTDGYIRKFDDASKSDATTNGTEAIDSYMTLPIVITEKDDKDIKINSIVVTTAGGSSDGHMSDTDSVDIEIYPGEGAEEVVEDIEDGATPLRTTTITGPGKANRLRNRTKGKALGIRLKNDTADST